jgi:hypothetical protein
VRIYDNGGTDAPDGSIDRYTVVFTRKQAADSASSPAFGVRQYPYLAMNGAPFHPQGFGQHGWSNHQAADTVARSRSRPPAVGRRCHLGKRIEWADLPHDCKRAVWQDYAAIWDIPTPREFTTARATDPGAAAGAIRHD